MPDARPLLLIDVDGVLNPFAAKRCPAGYVEEQIAGFPVRLRAADGPALLAYADRFELAWATTWEDQANSEIGPRIGLPPLAVIHFDFEGSGGTKHEAIDAFAGERPVIWLEDEPWYEEKRWANARNKRIPTLIVSINPGRGIIREQFAAIERFAASLEG